MTQFRLSVAALVAAVFLAACGSKPEPARLFPMGDKVQSGHLIYTAFETQWLNQLPQDPTPRVPQDHFFLIRISAVNGGGGEAVVPSLTIEDDHGKTYEELNNGDGVPQWIGYLRQVKPADTIRGNVVFDAPPGHYRLRVPDESSESFQLIDLPLNFGNEAPQVPIPGENADKKDTIR